MSAQAIISEFFLLYVIIYDNVQIKDGENMEELRLESGTQNPTLDMIVKIASALGKDVSLLLNDKEGEGCDH